MLRLRQKKILKIQKIFIAIFYRKARKEWSKTIWKGKVITKSGKILQITEKLEMTKKLSISIQMTYNKTRTCSYFSPLISRRHFSLSLWSFASPVSGNEKALVKFCINLFHIRNQSCIWMLFTIVSNVCYCSSSKHIQIPRISNGPQRHTH